MKKYSWIVALLAALAFAFAFVACDDGDSSKKKDKDGDKDLPEVTVEGEAIVIKAIGGGASSITIDKNTFAVSNAASSSIGFMYTLPDEVKGKGYGSVIVEVELLSETAETIPDFISFNAKDSDQMSNDVLIVGHTQAYHGELKIGTIVDKAAGVACSSDCLKYTAGTCIKGAKGSAEYPMSKLTKGVIAFQYNPYAGDITTSGWTSSSNATFKIAVTKITFPGGAAVEEEPKEEAKAEVLFDLADWLAGGSLVDGSGNPKTPFQKAGSVTVTADANGIVIVRANDDWSGIDLKTGDFTMDFDKFDYKVTITGSSDKAGDIIKSGETGGDYRELGRTSALATAGTEGTLTGNIPDEDFGNVRVNSTNNTGATITITAFKLEAVAK
jgi:hypothetical protein